MTNPRFPGIPGALLAGLLLASPAVAQRVPVAGRFVTPEEAAAYRMAPKSPATPDYGTSSTSALSINTCEAGIRDWSLYPFRTLNCDFLEPADVGLGSAGFPVHLPTGALITSITVYYFDTDGVVAPSIALQRWDTTGNNVLVLDFMLPVSSGGNTSVTAVPPAPYAVDNTAGSYALMAVLRKTASTNQAIYGFEVHYKLQVSPAPAFATFTDVPVGSPQHRFVEALVASGVTAGCGGGLYCPNQPVTRGQMAVFLASALGLHFPN